MPGIMPMKVIKVGSSSQSRIAQACDRCRSKKIRCDGIRPCCTPCMSVGFECKTSDKLSRRAFPRGYTESLEERVRMLENEVRELKDLLDEKEEQIDMLSRIGSLSRHRSASPGTQPALVHEANESMDGCYNDGSKLTNTVFDIQQPPTPLVPRDPVSGFLGSSNARVLIDSFRRRIDSLGLPVSPFDYGSFLSSDSRGPQFQPPLHPRTLTWKAPARLTSDQLVNVYFQEWAPLFPVLHRPSFLDLYEKYVSATEVIDDKLSLAQLNLVLGIAALSREHSSKLEELDAFEAHWQAAVDASVMLNSLGTLQCLILALIYCILKGDNTKLLQYKGLATGMSHRLGLHQSQASSNLDIMTQEMNKRVFWCLYTSDVFSASVLGLPQHLRNDIIQCEFPSEEDDEYLTSHGLFSGAPGDAPRDSSAVALFRAAQVLSNVLNENFAVAGSGAISFRRLAALCDELDGWSNTLSPHLRLRFSQGKPSTNVISSRCPILSLIYHYIRALIHRSAVCGRVRERSSVLALADSCKHIVQVLELLDERGFSFSVCLNKHELLITSGFGLLYQALYLNRDGKLIRDNYRLLRFVVVMLQGCGASGANDFSRLVDEVIPCIQQKHQATVSFADIPVDEGAEEENTGDANSASSPKTPRSKLRATHKQLKALASKFSPAKAAAIYHNDSTEHRRLTEPNIFTAAARHVLKTGAVVASSALRTSQSSEKSEFEAPADVKPLRRHSTALETANLDYSSFGNDPLPGVYPLLRPAASASRLELSIAGWGGFVSRPETETSPHTATTTSSMGTVLDLPDTTITMVQTGLQVAVPPPPPPLYHSDSMYGGHASDSDSLLGMPPPPPPAGPTVTRQLSHPPPSSLISTPSPSIHHFAWASPIWEVSEQIAGTGSYSDTASHSQSHAAYMQQSPMASTADVTSTGMQPPPPPASLAGGVVHQPVRPTPSQMSSGPSVQSSSDDSLVSTDSYGNFDFRSVSSTSASSVPPSHGGDVYKDVLVSEFKRDALDGHPIQ